MLGLELTPVVAVGPAYSCEVAIQASYVVVPVAEPELAYKAEVETEAELAYKADVHEVAYKGDVHEVAYMGDVLEPVYMGDVHDLAASGYH